MSEIGNDNNNKIKCSLECKLLQYFFRSTNNTFVYSCKKILFEVFRFLHKAPWLWSKPDYNKREITEIQ